MTWRVLAWGLVFAVTCGVSWLWPRIERAPTDFEIGVAFLKSDEPEHAMLFLDEPHWRGVAAYRAGRFAQASRDFGQDERVESLYNMGNSYARLKDWSNAIATYQRVLRFNPQHTDAQHNLALVKKASEQPQGMPVAMEAPPEQQPPEAQEPQSSIPQESTPQSTQARESEQSDTAGNTSDTDEAGDANDLLRPTPQSSTGEAGGAGAVGQSSEEKDRDSARIAGTVELKTRASARAPALLLRNIKDDAKKVLRARLHSVYESRIEGAAQ